MTGGKYGIKSGSADRTYEEALYCGIDTAIDNPTLEWAKSSGNNQLLESHTTPCNR